MVAGGAIDTTEWAVHDYLGMKDGTELVGAIVTPGAEVAFHRIEV